MSAAIDTDGPRFYVSVIEGYAIHPRASAYSKSNVLVATVIDSFYGTEHGRFASNDQGERKEYRYLHAGDLGWGLRCACGSRKSRQSFRCSACSRPGAYLGRPAALKNARDRCAELNAWHEREGWGE